MFRCKETIIINCLSHKTWSPNPAYDILKNQMLSTPTGNYAPLGPQSSRERNTQRRRLASALPGGLGRQWQWLFAAGHLTAARVMSVRSSEPVQGQIEAAERELEREVQRVRLKIGYPKTSWLTLINIDQYWTDYRIKIVTIKVSHFWASPFLNTTAVQVNPPPLSALQLFDGRSAWDVRRSRHTGWREKWQKNHEETHVWDGGIIVSRWFQHILTFMILIYSDHWWTHPRFMIWILWLWDLFVSICMPGVRVFGIQMAIQSTCPPPQNPKTLPLGAWVLHSTQ